MSLVNPFRVDVSENFELPFRADDKFAASFSTFGSDGDLLLPVLLLTGSRGDALILRSSAFDDERMI
jgi:hypothetical protein